MSEVQRQSLPKPSAFNRFALNAQTFLLRRNLMGAMSNFVMVLTTTGRKSGKKFSTPVGYIHDGDYLIGLSVGGKANWYQNLLKNPQVMLNIKGKDHRATAEAVLDDADRQRIFNIYRTEHARVFPRLFGIPLDSPEEALQQALADRYFVRYTLMD